MEKQLDTIWGWYEDQIEALLDFKLKVQTEMTIQVSRSKFLNYSPDEINEYFSKSTDELEHLACFSLISATEAALRIDFEERANRKNLKNRQLVKIFREINKNEDRIKLDEHILENWKNVIPAKKKAFSDFIGLLHYRHWLAHGRYWTPKFGQQYTVQTTFKIVDRLFDTINAN